MKQIDKRCTAFVVALIWAAVFSSIVSAAEVSRVQTNKGHIYIDQGKDAGFLIGVEVCFYAASGEKISCGVVKQTNPNYAMVKVNNREAKQIKVGMKAFVVPPNSETQVK